MVRRRRLELVYLLGSLLVLAASLHAPTAYSAAGDPPSGSPAGSVYQLPLEQGRSDAAPKGGGGTGAAPGEGGGQGEGDSLYRTENNFGSSSHVPGVAGTGGGGGGGPGVPGGPSAGTGEGGGGATIAGGANAGDVTDAGNTSVSASLALLGGITLLGVSVGLLSRRYRGRASS